MLYSNNLNVEEVDNYLKRIFDLQSKLLDKDFKIAMLEFELVLEKQLIESFKKYYMPEKKHA